MVDIHIVFSRFIVMVEILNRNEKTLLGCAEFQHRTHQYYQAMSDFYRLIHLEYKPALLPATAYRCKLS